MSARPQIQTEAEKLAAERKGFGELLRKLAEEVEAGRVPLCGVATVRLCQECPERHLRTFTYLENETVVEATLMVGVAHALAEGAVGVRNGLVHRLGLERAVAHHEARGATKQ